MTSNVGPQGYQGWDGYTGRYGDNGGVGPQGLTGNQGARGSQGTEGLSGPPGITYQGFQGHQGVPGLPGTVLDPTTLNSASIANDLFFQKLSLIPDTGNRSAATTLQQWARIGVLNTTLKQDGESDITVGLKGQIIGNVGVVYINTPIPVVSTLNSWKLVLPSFIKPDSTIVGSKGVEDHCWFLKEVVIGGEAQLIEGTVTSYSNGECIFECPVGAAPTHIAPRSLSHFVAAI